MLPQKLSNLLGKKCIVINPYANSIKCNVFKFFLKFVELAKEEGYTVICPIYGDQTGIDGCICINCSLGEIGTFLYKTRSPLVALRSGFVDVMIHTGVPVLCLEYTEFDRYKMFLFNSSEISEINSNVKDIFFDSSCNFERLAYDAIEKIRRSMNYV